MANANSNRKLAGKRKPAPRNSTPWMTVGQRGPLPRVVTPDEMRLLGAQLRTYDEAAAALHISRSSLTTRLRDNPALREAWESGRADTHATLRLRQIQIALSPTHPDAAKMLIHLGKVELGQTEKQQHEHTGAAGGPILVHEIRRLIVAADPARFADGPVIEHAGAEVPAESEGDNDDG
jgi:hypothetical protein